MTATTAMPPWLQILLAFCFFLAAVGFAFYFMDAFLAWTMKRHHHNLTWFATVRKAALRAREKRSEGRAV